jgi:hypothetical protein
VLQLPRHWRILMTVSPVLLEPTIASPGFGPVSAAGETLVIREWSDSGPSYLHIHQGPAQDLFLIIR